MYFISNLYLNSFKLIQIKKEKIIRKIDKGKLESSKLKESSRGFLSKLELYKIENKKIKSEIECWKTNMQSLMPKKITTEDLPDIKIEPEPEVDYIVLSSDDETSKKKQSTKVNSRSRMSLRNADRTQYKGSKQPNYSSFSKVS